MLRTGDKIRADVIQVEPYGIWMQRGSDRILVLIPETSWFSDVRDCREFCNIGDRLDVAVLRYVEQKGHWLGSIKHADPEADPWKDPSRYARATRHEGIVASELRNRDGSVVAWMIRLAPGVDGIVRKSELQEAISVGQRIDVVVERCDSADRKIELRIRSPDDRPERETAE